MYMQRKKIALCNKRDLQWGRGSDEWGQRKGLGEVL
jgi:hypothetical protein